MDRSESAAIYFDRKAAELLSSEDAKTFRALLVKLLAALVAEKRKD